MSYPSPKKAKEAVDSITLPNGQTVTADPELGRHDKLMISVLWVRFTDFGRVAESSKPVRELRSSKTTTIEEEPRGLGLVIDGRILVPWSNISWVEYAP